MILPPYLISALLFHMVFLNADFVPALRLTLVPTFLFQLELFFFSVSITTIFGRHQKFQFFLTPFLVDR